MPKALLPLGEGVLVDRVLEWVDESGIVGEQLFSSGRNQR